MLARYASPPGVPVGRRVTEKRKVSKQSTFKKVNLVYQEVTSWLGCKISVLKI